MMAYTPGTMKGLCHVCYASNIEISEISKGMPICLSCLVLEKISR
jgi:hypothetical protein